MSDPQRVCRRYEVFFGLLALSCVPLIAGCDAAGPISATMSADELTADSSGASASAASNTASQRGAANESNSSDSAKGSAPNDNDAEEPDEQTPQPELAENDGPADHPFPQRFPAPSLSGGVRWINTAGPITLADLRGKFVVLDFWTYCCINCIHVLPELKKLEKAYPNELVVIGVHSAKFETEQDSDNITEAVLRYEIEHPVVNDAGHSIWNRFSIRSWPSLVVIDPEGFMVARHSGEIAFEALDQFFKRGLAYYRRNGSLDETPLRFDLERYRAPETPLSFPGKVLADAQRDRLFIADSNHNRIVVTQLDGTLIETIGSGAIGDADGDFSTASFNHPQGMALHGDVLYVADTENHLLRKVDLANDTVSTIAGVGTQGRFPFPGMDGNVFDRLAESKLPDRWVGKPPETALNSPWALWVHDDDLFIAMAGPHQIWKMPVDESEIGPHAGNGREDIVDGPLLPREPFQEGYSSFAQPSGLASDGERLFVADSEGSSIRSVPFDGAGEVTTVLGTAELPFARLFTFGDVDGQGDAVRFQHLLGLVFHEGRLFVADTYNNKIKVVDVVSKTSQTLVGDGEPGADDDPPRFDEPAGITAAAGKLYVADTNNHLVRVVDLENDNRVSTLDIVGLEPPTLETPPPAAFPGAEQLTLEPVSVRAADGKVRLEIEIALPPDHKINTDAPMAYLIEAPGEGGLIDRKKIGDTQQVESPAQRLEIEVPLAETQGSDTLKVSLGYHYCREGNEGICKAASVVWTVSIEVTAEAEASEVTLEHVTQ